MYSFWGGSDIAAIADIDVKQGIQPGVQILNLWVQRVRQGSKSDTQILNRMWTSTDIQ